MSGLEDCGIIRRKKRSNHFKIQILRIVNIAPQASFAPCNCQKTDPICAKFALRNICKYMQYLQICIIFANLCNNYKFATKMDTKTLLRASQQHRNTFQRKQILVNGLTTCWLVIQSAVTNGNQLYFEDTRTNYFVTKTFFQKEESLIYFVL